MESFLKEQLRRIQELTRQVSSLKIHTAGFARELAGCGEQSSQSPIAAVRDLRTFISNRPQRFTEPRDRSSESTRRRRRR